ncbi:hypothetical protein C8J57DRAFT_1232892 [Mycena rebaudengoi]|nr:hypothetical protein C8J57DRAFT_1232892 [Mycena rebaudengoi]
MSKRHQPGRKKREELGLDTYTPRLSQAQLNENNRQSVHEYYVRRAKQLQRRRWDPPKNRVPHSVTDPEPRAPPQLEAPAAQLKPTNSSNLNDVPIADGGRNSDVQDPERAASAGESLRTDVSCSREELAAMCGLVLLGQPALILDPDMPVDGPNENHGQGGGPLPPLILMPEVQVEHPISTGALTRIQAAQLTVAKLNSGALTAPTEDDRSRWNARRIRHLRIIKESLLPEKENLKIRGWTVDVADALGNHLYWELDSEEEAECRRADEECRRAMNRRY